MNDLKKKAYAQPKLIVYGDFKKITQSSGIAQRESRGGSRVD